MTTLGRGYLLIVIFLTALGGLSVIFPELDIANYFRPWMVAASLPALWIFVSTKQKPLTRTVGLLIFAANLTLLLYPVFTNLPGRTTDKAKTLKIISVNVWHINQNIDRVADYLENAKADIVVLQEMHNTHLGAVRNRLRQTYPFILTCRCRNLVLLSRLPWQLAGGNRFTRDTPALIWARFSRPGRGSYRVVGVHAADPRKPEIHINHMRWLTNRLPNGERLIVVGDFNATPWSANLMQMAARYRLRRALTFATSWPSQIQWPLFLIDNAFVSSLFEIRSSKIGPDVGSDHRPVVVEVAIPL